jgi:hypothetical protein
MRELIGCCCWCAQQLHATELTRVKSHSAFLNDYTESDYDDAIATMHWKPGGGPTQFREDQRNSGGGKSKRSGAQFFARPLCSSGTYGYGANAGTAHRRPRSHVRWCGAAFFKEILKALLCSAGAGYGHRPPNPNGASAHGVSGRPAPPA